MLSDPDIRIFDDPAALSQAVADLIVDVGEESYRSRGRFMIALSGGGTPEPVYRLLAGQAYRGRLNWPAAHVFWGDERCVPPDAPGSNYDQARRLLLDHVSAPAGQIHRIKGELTPEKAAADYRSLLAGMADEGLAWPRLDLALMGMGSDGHTASLFPGLAAGGEGRLAAIAASADYGGRPAERVSLTPAMFNSARNILYLVKGADKAEAVAAVLGGRADPEQWPAARIRPDAGQVIWFLDDQAARLLHRKKV